MTGPSSTRSRPGPPVRLHDVPRSSSATTAPPTTTAGAQSPRVPSASRSGGRPSHSAGEPQTTASARELEPRGARGDARRAAVAEAAPEQRPGRSRPRRRPPTRRARRHRPGDSPAGSAQRRGRRAPPRRRRCRRTPRGCGGGIGERRGGRRERRRRRAPSPPPARARRQEGQSTFAAMTAKPRRLDTSRAAARTRGASSVSRRSSGSRNAGPRMPIAPTTRRA